MSWYKFVKVSNGFGLFSRSSISEAVIKVPFGVVDTGHRVGGYGIICFDRQP